MRNWIELEQALTEGVTEGLVREAAALTTAGGLVMVSEAAALTRVLAAVHRACEADAALEAAYRDAVQAAVQS